MIRRITQGLDINHSDVSPLKNIQTIFESMRTEMMSRVEATRDELEAFRIAMDMEKEGVAFYKRLLAAAGKDKERAFLEQLIREEQKHYDIFSNTYHFLFDTGNWFMWEELSIVEGG
jgi:rubrerythrin